MAVNAGSTVLQQLRFVVASWKEDCRTDVELLHRFVQSRDEQAFTTLVGRYGELVWGVCLRVLRNRADAEDAFQATFLRLARDAGRIVNREALAGWLFRVARDCAIDLRRSILRQRRIEERLAAVSARAENETAPTDLRLLLDEALARLTSAERSVLVLVCLEGRTYSDAALELGCSIAAVHRRFLRAQTRLRRQFARRGPAAIGLLAVVLCVGSTPEALAVSPRLLAASVDVGLAASSGPLPHEPVCLFAGNTAVGLNHVGAVAVMGLAVALAISLYVAVLPSAELATPSVSSRADEPSPTPTSEVRGTIVSGLIRGADGEPLAGAAVAARARRPFGPGQRGLRDTILAKATTDAGGRFTIRVTDDFATWFTERIVTLHSSAPGLAPATLPVRLSDSGAVEMRLARGSPLRGRFVGPDRKPACGARVEVVRIGNAAAEPVVGAATGSTPPEWPEAALTDADGKFRLPGLGGSENVWVRVNDPRFALDTFRVDHTKGACELRLQPAVPLTVEVRSMETSRPLSGARVSVITDRIQSHPHFCTIDHAILGSRTVPADIDAVTDPGGSVCVGVALGDRVEILVHPPASMDVDPHVGVRAIVDIGDGAGARKHVAFLPRGRWVSGTVIDAATNRPIEGAVVHWGREGAAKPEWRDDILVGRDALTRTGADGRFRLAVLPGNCSIRVYGPTLDYPSTHSSVPGAVNSTLFAHAITDLVISPDGEVPPVRIALSRGTAIDGRLGYGEKASSSAFMLSSGRVSPVRPYACLTLPVRENLFTMPGCRPGLVTRAYVLDPVARVGGVADFSTTSPGPAVSLSPCGTIRFRVRDEDGAPRSGQDVGVSLLVERDRQLADEPVSDAQPVEWFDSVNYPTRPKTGDDGRVELPALIPGARYAIAVGSGRGKVLLGRFTVTASEVVTLPDFVLTDFGGTR